MNQNPQPPVDRLKKGSMMLGQLWRAPEHRCPSGWSLNDCNCQPLRKFCVARNLWIILGIEASRDFEEGPFGLALALTASEWDSTGLTMKIQHPEIGMISIGMNQDCVTDMMDMAKMMDAPEVLASTLRVLKAFPKARVEGLSDPVAAPAVLSIEIPVEMAMEANPDEAFE